MGQQKPEILLQVHITKKLDRFICGEANKDGRTRAGIVRRWLELIQKGKIKVEGVGGDE